jgi:hypothetical protein
MCKACLEAGDQHFGPVLWNTVQKGSKLPVDVGFVCDKAAMRTAVPMRHTVLILAVDLVPVSMGGEEASW